MAKKKKKVTKTRAARPAAASAPEPSMNLKGSSDRGRARLAQLADQLGRSYGRSTALPLAAAPVARVMRLPFGILMLDWRTRGGMVLHRINRLVGPKSTLKSTLCLRALRSAQNHCRHCKFPMVVNPVSGEVDCRCPATRFKLHDDDDFAWLPSAEAIQVSYGHLPERATMKNVPGVGRVPVLKCDPPPHLLLTADGKQRKQKPKAREIPLVETWRNEPMRCLYLDSEHTIDEGWARANGVDTELVLLVGGSWAEQSFQTIEDAVLTREFDLIIIDSTSVLTPQKELEKRYTDAPKVAARATVMSRFVRRHLSAAFEDGLTSRYAPTVLCTSQITTKFNHRGSWTDSTDGNSMNHAVSLDIRMHEEGYKLDANHEAVYGDFGFEVKKNKAGGSPGATGTIRFWLKEAPDHPVGDSDDLATVMRYAREPSIRLIDDSGSGSSNLVLHSPYLGDEGQQSFSRVGDCETFLRENPTVYSDLRERVLSALMHSGETLTVEGEAPAAATATEGM